MAVLATQAGSPVLPLGKDTCFHNAWRQSAIWLAILVSITHYEFPMVRANCRARFTAADFDFIVRTLARSQTDQVSLVDLLSDVETRDSILDHPRLVDAILNHWDTSGYRRNFIFMFWRDTCCNRAESATASFAITSRRCWKHFRTRTGSRFPRRRIIWLNNTFP